MTQNDPSTTNEASGELAIAHHVRETCIQAAQAGYEEAAMAGLCGEGALEIAISSMQRLDLAKLLADLQAGASSDADYRR